MTDYLASGPLPSDTFSHGNGLRMLRGQQGESREEEKAGRRVEALVPLFALRPQGMGERTCTPVHIGAVRSRLLATTHGSPKSKASGGPAALEDTNGDADRQNRVVAITRDAIMNGRWQGTNSIFPIDMGHTPASHHLAHKRVDMP